MINVEEKKSKIVSFLESSGPSLPVRIAKEIQMDPVFASAILSELLSIKKIKLSHMKVGSSPLYLLDGQEQRLEEHSDNLKSIEKETYLKLKNEIVLSDENEQPATRVALRSIKDFAKPFKYQEKIYWKYAFAEDSTVQEKLTPSKQVEETPKDQEPKPEKEEKVNEEKEEKTIEKPKEETKEKDTSEKLKEVAEKIIDEENLKDIKRKAGVEEPKQKDEVPKAWVAKKEEITKAKTLSKTQATEEKTKKVENIFEETSEETSEEKPEFYNEVTSFLEKKGLELIKEIQIEKKEIVARVNMSSKIGNLNLLLIAKDKKSITQDEINSALQRARHEQMPCLYLIRKEPSKKLQSELDKTHLIKVEVI